MNWTLVGAIWAIGCLVTLMFMAAIVTANRSAGRAKVSARLVFSVIAASLGWPLYWPWAVAYVRRGNGVTS